MERTAEPNLTPMDASDVTNDCVGSITLGIDTNVTPSRDQDQRNGEQNRVTTRRVDPALASVCSPRDP